MSPIYGCTITEHCRTTFNYHLDWVLHEDFAHAPCFDIWFCICNQGYYNLNDFEIHFKLIHIDMEFKPIDYLLGPCLGERFYCGFCGNVIASDNPRWSGWRSSRQCHLQAHFEGWDPMIEDTGTDIPKTIADWQYMQIVPH
jgi:hypothetical protein